MDRRLRRFLLRNGASPQEIDEAEAGGHLAMLAFDRAVLPGKRKYTMRDLADRAQTDLTTARTVWRAIGFPDLPDDLAVFTDADVVAMSGFVARFKEPWFYDWNLDRALPQARVLSSALARIADAESDDIARSVDEARRAGLTDEDLALLVAERLDFDEIARLLDHTHRLQLRAAIWRKLVGSEPGAPGTVIATVGFVDLVGYTALAEGLDNEELGALVEHFASLAHDTVVESGGRIVKTIGDEVMFITEEPAAAATIALRLARASNQDAVLPDARAGLASGPVLSREGDYYGQVVNLASRLTELAFPGTVLVSNDLATALEDQPEFRLRRLGRRKVRGIGRVELYRLDAAPVPAG